MHRKMAFYTIISSLLYVPLYCMHPFVKTLSKATGASFTLYVAGTIANHFNKKEIIDVSTPSAPILVQHRLRGYEAQPLLYSVTKRQLEKDPACSMYPYSAETDSVIAFKQKLNALFRFHQWVFLSKMREKLVDWALLMCYDEQKYVQEKGYFSCVHGTTEGASILMRTIFDDVFQARTKQNFVNLRSQPVVDQDIVQAKSGADFFTKSFAKAPEFPLTVCTGITSVNLGTTKVWDDHLPHIRNALLSANFGLFGNSSLSYGYKESSVEFIARPYSWAIQTLDIVFGLRSALFNISIFSKIAQDIRTYHYNSLYIATLFDKHIKSLYYYADDPLKDIFKEYKVEKLFDKYKDTLEQFRTLCSAGLVQLFIPKEKTKWCYVAQPLGGMVSSDAYAVENEENQLFYRYQVRVLLHPDVLSYEKCSPDNVIMKFYLNADPDKIKEIIKQMYAIAQEAKELKLNQV